MALLDDIGAALVAAGLVNGGTGWTLLKSRDVDEVTGVAEKTVTVYEFGGDNPEPRWAIDYPNFQVRVRGARNGYSAARDQMQAVFNALHEQEAAVGAAYVYVYGLGGVIPLGYDANTRPVLVQNFRVMKDRA